MRRRLTAILSADVAGFTSLMERDEAGALARLKAQETDIFIPCVTAHGGRVVKLMGDGALVEFGSVVSAVACALDIQDAVAAAQADAPRDARILYRIGVNSGDVIVEGDDIFGNGVNVAVRLQGMAPPGGVAISRDVREEIDGKVGAAFDDLGARRMKNIARPLHVFATRGAHGAAPALDRERISICVLPFANMSGDPEQEYFADGVTEDIITDLSKVSALAVASRNTSFTFKGKASDIGAVSRQLRCAYVLEGSVRKAGNRVRITAQLIEGSSDSHLWAERYDRNLNDIFAVQTEISEAIVAALKLRLLPTEKKAIEQRSTSNPEAYKLFLMAREYNVMGSERHEPVILRLCRRAVEIDPGYAQAWALLALVTARMHRRGAAADNGMDAAERALALDRGLAAAHTAMGRILANSGRIEEAAIEDEIALKLEPESYEVNIGAGRNFIMMRCYDDAIRHLEKAAILVDADYLAAALMIQCYDAKGDMEGAKSAARRALTRIEKIIAQEPDHGSAMGHGAGILALLGETERAKEWTARALLLDPDNQNLQYNLACAMVRLGETDAALELLETSTRNASMEVVRWAREDTDLDPIRGHPRFQQLLERVAARFSDAENATIVVQTSLK